MAEEKKEKEVKEPTQTERLITQANEAAKRIEKANAKMLELLEKQEASKVEEILSGEAEAGKPQEETPAEYVKKVMSNDLKRE